MERTNTRKGPFDASSFDYSKNLLKRKEKDEDLARTNVVLTQIMTKSLVFITGNANKLKEVKRILSTSDHFELSSHDLDLPEIQGTTKEVALAKCAAAATALGSSCMTEVSLLRWNEKIN